MSTESYEDAIKRLGELLRYTHTRTLSFSHSQIRHNGFFRLWDDHSRRSFSHIFIYLTTSYPANYLRKMGFFFFLVNEK